MEVEQIHEMIRISRETGNFRDLQRLHKVLMFQKPGFKYPRRRRRLFTESSFEIARKNNGFRRLVTKKAAAAN